MKITSSLHNITKSRLQYFMAIKFMCLILVKINVLDFKNGDRIVLLLLGSSRFLFTFSTKPEKITKSLFAILDGRTGLCHAASKYHNRLRRRKIVCPTSHQTSKTKF